MKGYNTKQKEKIIEFLKSQNGRHMSASEIKNAFDNQGISIGLTTIYRHLAKLEEENLLRKYIVDKTSPACYEYLGDGVDSCNNSCFHLKCDICGDLTHLKCDELNKINTHLFGNHGFKLDGRKTVFHGKCKECDR